MKRFSFWNRVQWQCECGSTLEWQDQISVRRHYLTQKHKDYERKCHHCHFQHDDRRLSILEGKRYCHKHSPNICRYLGCFEKESVHAIYTKLSPI
jgi:hypothetical protein